MRTFIPYEQNQPFLLPPDLREWLPEGSLALFISDVVDTLDLSGIYRVYEDDDRGHPAYHPAMMVKLLIYDYSTGKASSRKLERATAGGPAVGRRPCRTPTRPCPDPRPRRTSPTRIRAS